MFVARVVSREGDEAELHDARRLWYWAGAASLSQLAMEGVSIPEKCKFPVPMARVTVLGVIEIIDMTANAKRSIDEVPVWKC